MSVHAVGNQSTWRNLPVWAGLIGEVKARSCLIACPYSLSCRLWQRLVVSSLQLHLYFHVLEYQFMVRCAGQWCLTWHWASTIFVFVLFLHYWGVSKVPKWLKQSKNKHQFISAMLQWASVRSMEDLLLRKNLAQALHQNALGEMVKESMVDLAYKTRT